MQIALVIGSTVATMKDNGLHGRKLLIVRPADTAGQPSGQPYVAVDTVSASYVLCLQRTPQGDESDNEVGAGHCSDDAALKGVHEGNATRSFENASPASGRVAQFGQFWTDG